MPEFLYTVINKDICYKIQFVDSVQIWEECLLL